ALGSVKSNIGHGESASGMASVTKVLLQLRHGQLVPSLHAREANPHIDFANSAFVVQEALGSWARPRLSLDGEVKEYPRRAGVSSFGAGGANAHLVLEEYVPSPPVAVRPPIDARHPALLVLSAKTEQRLEERVRRLLDWLER